MAVFNLADKARLEVDGRGLPIAWTQNGRGWSLDISYGDDDLPKSLKFNNAEGQMAILLVKSREKLDKPFSEEQLRLKIPAGTEALPLAKYKTR